MVGTYRQLVRSGVLIVSLLIAAGVAGCGMSTDPSQTTSSSVLLAASKSNYNPSETITVTLTNNASQTIYFPDHQTDCTVILLQIQVVQAGSTTWPDARNCAIYSASTLFSLTQGSMPVELPPEDGFWQTGIYRATLTYSPSPDSPPATVYSAPFQVAGQPGSNVFPGPQVTATPGPVTLSVGPITPPPPPYSPNDPITVTLANNSHQTIYYFNNYTDCSVILLQWEVGTNKWSPVENCQSGKTLDPLQPLATDKSVTITLQPQTGPWQTGIYRAALLYSTSPNLPPTTQVYSAGFEVAETQGG